MKPLLTFLILTLPIFLSAQTLTRGPYLQAATPTQITLRWRTDVACLGSIRYGTALNAQNKTATEPQVTTEHIVTLTNLTPETQFFYTLYGGTVLLQGNNIDNHFFTFPTEGSKKKRRIWVIGDEGTGDDNQRNVAKAFEGYVKQNNIPYIDLWLTLGDNAYSSGTQEEFQSNFFDIYKNTKITKQTPLFPCLGNHDYCNSNATDCQDNHQIAYKDIFTVPTKGEAGGKASNKWEYYSYNWGNAHFVCLDSYGEENNKRFWLDEAQRRWLEQDLQHNQNNPHIKWTILYWHHPPYTMGSYSSDNDGEMRGVRENLIPIIEKYKVDLVLNGHSHVYERSRLMRGHIGKEASFDTLKHLAPIKNNGSSSGLYDNSTQSCPFIKNSKAIENEGIIYVVNGSSGGVWSENESFPHEAMRAYTPTATQASFNKTKQGSFYIEIEDNRLDAKFIDITGAVADQFTMMKDVVKKDTLTVKIGESISLKASWLGSYKWSNNTSTQSISVTPSVKTTYLVRDIQNCLRDTFEVKVTPLSGITENEKTFTIFPNPASTEIVLQDIDFQNNKQIEIYNIIGQKVKEKQILSETMVLDISDLEQGIYMLKIGFSMKKIIKN